MTDHAGYLVTLDKDYGEDDEGKRRILEAIAMIRGVIYVAPVVADPHQDIAELRAQNEIRKRLFDALYNMKVP